MQRGHRTGAPTLRSPNLLPYREPMFQFFSAQDAPNKKRFMRGALILVGALFLLWLIVWLLPGGSPPPVSSDAAGTVAGSASGSGTELPLITPGRILVVLLLAGGLGYAVYLHRKQSGSATSSSAPMQSLGHLALTQDQQLTLVCCQDEVLLLGVSPNDITLLRSYPRDAFARPAGDAPPHSGAPPTQPDASLSGFARVLRQYTSNGRHA